MLLCRASVALIPGLVDVRQIAGTLNRGVFIERVTVPVNLDSLVDIATAGNVGCRNDELVGLRGFFGSAHLHLLIALTAH